MARPIAVLGILLLVPLAGASAPSSRADLFIGGDVGYAETELPEDGGGELLWVGDAAITAHTLPVSTHAVVTLREGPTETDPVAVRLHALGADGVWRLGASDGRPMPLASAGCARLVGGDQVVLAYGAPPALPVPGAAIVLGTWEGLGWAWQDGPVAAGSCLMDLDVDGASVPHLLYVHETAGLPYRELRLATPMPGGWEERTLLSSLSPLASPALDLVGGRAFVFEQAEGNGGRLLAVGLEGGQAERVPAPPSATAVAALRGADGAVLAFGDGPCAEGDAAFLVPQADGWRSEALRGLCAPAGQRLQVRDALAEPGLRAVAADLSDGAAASGAVLAQSGTRWRLLPAELPAAPAALWLDGDGMRLAHGGAAGGDPVRVGTWAPRGPTPEPPAPTASLPSQPRQAPLPLWAAAAAVAWAAASARRNL